MRDYVGEHFAIHTGKRRPAIVCKDGYVLSVQAADGLYSSPQDNVGPWTSFEITRLSDCRCTRIEGWVPRARVNARIHRHGGPA